MNTQADMSQHIWEAYRHGATLGSLGSENGIIVADEQYGSEARITLEENARAARYAITCGYAGIFVHTHYFDDHPQQRFLAMKTDLTHLITEFNVSEPAPSEVTDEAVQAIKKYMLTYP